MGVSCRAVLVTENYEGGGALSGLSCGGWLLLLRHPTMVFFFFLGVFLMWDVKRGFDWLN